MLLPLYPFMVIGLSFMLEWSVKQLRSSLRFRHLAGFASVALALPVILTLCMSAYLFVFGQDFSREDVSAYQEVASYINANVGPSDIVVADPHTARFINAKVTEPLISYIQDHRQVVYMDSNLSDDRFTFNASYRNAKYFVLHSSAEEVEKDPDYAGVTDILDEISMWPSVRIKSFYLL